MALDFNVSWYLNSESLMWTILIAAGRKNQTVSFRERKTFQKKYCEKTHLSFRRWKKYWEEKVGNSVWQKSKQKKKISQNLLKDSGKKSLAAPKIPWNSRLPWQNFLPWNGIWKIPGDGALQTENKNAGTITQGKESPRFWDEIIPIHFWNELLFISFSTLLTEA